MRSVRCTTPDCSQRGVVRNVPDRRAAPGVVYRPDLLCAACGAAVQDDAAPKAARREKAVRRPPETRKG